MGSDDAAIRELWSQHVEGWDGRKRALAGRGLGWTARICTYPCTYPCQSFFIPLILLLIRGFRDPRWRVPNRAIIPDIWLVCEHLNAKKGQMTKGWGLSSADINALNRLGIPHLRNILIYGRLFKLPYYRNITRHVSNADKTYTL